MLDISYLLKKPVTIVLNFGKISVILSDFVSEIRAAIAE